MDFNQHSDLAGKHAFLSASKYHWVNYSDEKLLETFARSMAAARGTALHDLAHKCIRLGVKLQNTGQTLNMYVNDCIGYRMQPEQILVYSKNAFGTTDAISFRQKLLQVFDLKTGEIPASLTQPKIYAALFCLEYKVRPGDIDYDLRIYQNDEIDTEETDPEEILYFMDRIITFDRLIESNKEDLM